MKDLTTYQELAVFALQLKSMYAPFPETVELSEAEHKALTTLCKRVEREALDKAAEALPDNDTNCAEFYVGETEGCEPVEHARRNARFFYRMEAQEAIEALKKEVTE